jgi:molybdenum cofactor synthesis domain-containing protein
MNTVGILVVGNELLDGVTLDTNTQWMINQLKPLNYHVTETITVRDDTSEIAKALNRMIDDKLGLIITTGGLGPTYDDMTLKGIAEGLGVEMEVNPEALAIVERQYKNFFLRGVVDSPEITDARKKMAIFPDGANPLDNKAGGAPGVIIDIGETSIVSLPGVPSELKWIFTNPLNEILAKRAKGHYTERIINLSLNDESTLAPLIDEANKLDDDVYIKSMVKSLDDDTIGFNIRLWISCSGDSLPIIKTKVDTVSDYLISLAREKLGND